MSKVKRQRKEKRKKRVRSKIFGTKKCPRLSVFRSNSHIYAQLIDDEKGVTLLSASDREVKADKKKGNTPKGVSATGQTEDAEKKSEGTEKGKIKGSNKVGGTERVERAYKVGELIAKKAIKSKIESVVFDRSGYRFHGRVATLAEGARKGGLKF